MMENKGASIENSRSVICGTCPHPGTWDVCKQRNPRHLTWRWFPRKPFQTVSVIARSKHITPLDWMFSACTLKSAIFGLLWKWQKKKKLDISNLSPLLGSGDKFASAFLCRRIISLCSVFIFYFFPLFSVSPLLVNGFPRLIKAY